jgi:hypothetical protein
MTSNKLDLSIIILNWNTKQLLNDCLDSLDQFIDPELKTEVIIVDNNSKDGSKKFIQQYQFSKDNLIKKTIFNSTNQGFAKGNNQAIKQAQGKCILLLNSDTKIKQNSIKTLHNYLESHPKTTAVSPMLLNMDGSKQIDYYMKFPNFWQMIFYHNGLLRPIAMRTPLRTLLVNPKKDQPFPVDQLPGAALMADRQTFDQIGLLDENFDFLFEDVDWCFRAKLEHNGKLMVNPNSEIMHVGGASWKKKLAKDRVGFYKQYFKSLFKFVDKHYQHKKPLLKLGLSFSLLTNALAHIITLRINKAGTQIKLISLLINDF